MHEKMLKILRIEKFWFKLPSEKNDIKTQSQRYFDKSMQLANVLSPDLYDSKTRNINKYIKTIPRLLLQ